MYIDLKKIIPFLCLVMLMLMAASNALLAQGKQRVVQFSGLIVSGEDDYGVPGVHIYIPHAGRGVTSNQYGYFSMATLAGDSAIISAVSFKKQYYIIPDDGRESISVIIYLQSDTTMLPVVEVFPYPTEELFKEAFLALRLPETDMDNMRRNLDEKVMARIAKDMGMSPSANHTYYMNQHWANQANRNFQPTIPLLNPFAWAKFIQSVKRGDLKRKKDD
jgi:hypothetical protein